MITSGIILVVMALAFNVAALAWLRMAMAAEKENLKLLDESRKLLNEARDIEYRWKAHQLLIHQSRKSPVKKELN